jgi:hypothetical protein
MGLYYKTLRIRNLRKTVKFRSKLMLFLLSVTNTLVLTNTLAYYGIRRLRIHNVFIVQAPVVCSIKQFGSVMYGKMNDLCIKIEFVQASKSDWQLQRH